MSGNPSLLQSPAVLELAEKHGLTAQQVIFKFCQRSVRIFFEANTLLNLKSLGNVTRITSIGITPLSGTTNQQHMKEDVAVESAPQFAAGDVKALETALRNAAARMA